MSFLSKRCWRFKEVQRLIPNNEFLNVEVRGGRFDKDPHVTSERRYLESACRTWEGEMRGRGCVGNGHVMHMRGKLGCTHLVTLKKSQYSDFFLYIG